MKLNKTIFILSIIMLIGGSLRFYNLDWGQGLFTHPDEYHIAASVNQISFPDQMHPHFFSYGTVTIYLIYFTQEIFKYTSSIFHLPFSIFNAFLVGRFYSALFSTLTIFVIYKICRTFLSTKFSLLAAFLVALTPGLIQQAHFATPESALIFFLFVSLFFMLKFLKNQKILYSILASIFLGLALGVKISSVVFLLPLIITIILYTFQKIHFRGASSVTSKVAERTPSRWIMGIRFIGLTLASLIATFATFVLVAPYVFLDFPAFRSNLEYEGGLAIGKIPVFYTRQFIDTIPIVFQMEKIFPYALGLALLVFGPLGFFLIVAKHLVWWQAERKRSHDTSEVNTLFVITIAFLSLFLPSAFLFAKWTRFIAPTFPFFAIFAVFFLEGFKKNRLVFYFLSVVMLVGTILWTTAFFSIYASPDVRITASRWLESNVKSGSGFLVEGGNMVDLPLTGNFQRTSLDFYRLEDPLARQQIADALYASDYFLVQSRRVFKNHQRLPNIYPKTASFYDALFDGDLGFEEIKEFHSFPKLEVGSLKLEVNDESAEETWSVFDHPVIRVFKKETSFTKEDYAKFLEI